MMPDKIVFPQVKIIQTAEDGYAYEYNGMTVIQSVARELDGKMWLHTSFSRRSRMPEYKDMQAVKTIFIGSNRQAIMIMPEKAKHVNIHPFCLHFFTPIVHEPLPDFTHGRMII